MVALEKEEDLAKADLEGSGAGFCPSSQLRREARLCNYEQKQQRNDPCMIEIGARLAGGRKAIMASKTVPGWNPFDAMLDAHCGFPLRVPPSFSPVKVARHVYVPSDKTGILRSYTGDDFKRLPSYDDHVILGEVGKPIKRAVDLMSFAGFVWLVGTQEQIERDANDARDNFKVEVDPLPEATNGAVSSPQS